MKRADTFTASNGWYIDENGDLVEPSGFPYLDDEGIRGAERFFIERRDHELGRWRDPVFSEWVCYPGGADGVLVLNEKIGSTHLWSRSLAAQSFESDITGEDIAARYFQAHPQHKPLPIVTGRYTHRREYAECPSRAEILIHDPDYGWTDGNGEEAEDLAQKWHDAGELVRLTIAEVNE